MANFAYALLSAESFGTLWFWVLLFGGWTWAAGHPLGVSYDMVLMARRHGGAAEQDLQDVTRVQVTRRLRSVEGMTAVALAAFALTALLILSVRGFELAQAGVVILAPALVARWLGLRTARAIYAADEGGAGLHKRLRRLRFWYQLLGAIAVLFAVIIRVLRIAYYGPLA